MIEDASPGNCSAHQLALTLLLKGKQAALRRIALVGLLLSITACSLTPTSPPAPSLATLPPADPTTQRLSFERDGETRVLIGVLSHDNEQLQLALLSPQGQRLLTLVRDASGARFLPGAVFEPPFSADWLASRLSWSLWSEAQLANTFAGSDWSLTQAGQERRIYRGRQLVARLRITPTCQVIDDIEAGYQLSVASLTAPSHTGAITNNTTATDPPCPSM